MIETLRSPKVAIIDYGMGNLFSVKQACEVTGMTPLITSDITSIINSEAIILPGVGSFGDAMKQLKSLNLIGPIKECISAGKYFMGLCLGLQLLFTESEEFGNHKGMNIIEGTVVKFHSRKATGEPLKVPQIGWNRIFSIPSEEDRWSSSPLRGLENGEYMYFVHSFYTIPSDKRLILTTTNYGDIDYCSGILWNNICAFQFHPEKSSQKGIRLYKNWFSMICGNRSE